MFFHIFARIYKPDSVIDSYLSRPVIAHRLKRHFHPKMDTALHVGKDFAVSLLPSDRIIPEGTLSLSALASLLAPLCLRTAGVTRYRPT